MNTIIELNDELEVLKAQMQVLTRHLDNNDVITEDMIHATTSARMERILPKKGMMWLSLLVCGLFIPAFAVWGTVTQHTYSVALCVYTVLMCWFGCWKTIEYFRGDMHVDYSEGSLTEISEKVMKFRQSNNRQQCITYIIMFSWMGWFVLENLNVLKNSLDNTIGVGIVFAIVIICSVTYTIKSNKLTREILRDIEELQK